MVSEKEYSEYFLIHPCKSAYMRERSERICSVIIIIHLWFFRDKFVPLEIMETQIWTEIILASLNQVWLKFLSLLPNLVGALIVLIVGWIIAVILGRLVARALKILKVDVGLEKIGAKKSLEAARVKLDVANLLGALVKWFLIIVAFLAAADILNLPQVTQFLGSVLFYIPNVIVAVVILLIGILLANFLEKVVKGSVRVAKLSSAKFLGSLTKWAVTIFAGLAALIQLGIASSLLETLFTGLVAMLALAGGLAFGLGGRDEASRIIGRIRDDISSREE